VVDQRQVMSFRVHAQQLDRAKGCSPQTSRRWSRPAPRRRPAGGELVGAWRPRKSGKNFTVAVQSWRKLPATMRQDITEQAERLAAYRGIALKTVEFDG
jgi:hypothetical protein